MALTLSIEDNFRAFARYTDKVRLRQTPFATAQTLNALAFEGRRLTVNRLYPTSFDVRNKRFINASMRVAKANKRKLEARLYDRLGREYLEKQARGGNGTLCADRAIGHS